VRGLPLGVWNLPPGVRLRDIEGRSMRAIHFGDPEEETGDGPEDDEAECDEDPGECVRTTEKKTPRDDRR
jgi:hypothetical protein